MAPVHQPIAVLRELVGPLRALGADLVRRIVDRTYAEIPGYRGVPPADLEEATRRTLDFVLSGFAEGRVPDEPDEWSFDDEVVRRRVGQGVQATDWVDHSGVFAQELQADILLTAQRAGLPEGEVMQAVMALWDLVRGGVSFTAQRFAAATGEQLEADATRRKAFVEAAVGGRLTAGELRRRAAALELDPDTPHVAARMRPREGTAAVVLQHLRRGQSTVGPRAVWAEVDGEIWGLSPGAPEPGPGVVCGLGGPAPLEAAPEAFADATIALEAAWVFGGDGPCRVEDLGALPMVTTAGRAGDALAERLVAAVERAGPSGPTLVETVAAYLEHGLGSAATAQALHLHPNSLRKRLRRYEELTGTDLRCMDDVVAVWWALKRRAARGRAG